VRTLPVAAALAVRLTLLLAFIGFALGCGSWRYPDGGRSESELRSPLPDDIRILQEGDGRYVRLTENTERLARKGDVFYVCVYQDASLQILTDPDTGKDLQATIVNSQHGWPRAWLMGLKPRGASLVGAVLRREPPTASSQAAAREDEARAAERRKGYPPPTG